MVFFTTWERCCLFLTPKVFRKLYIQRNIALERDIWKRTEGTILIARTWIGRKIQNIGKHAPWRDTGRALNVREPFARLVKRFNVGFVSDMRFNTLSNKARECCLNIQILCKLQLTGSNQIINDWVGSEMWSYDSDILLLSLYCSVHFERIWGKRERISQKSMWIIEFSELLRSAVLPIDTAYRRCDFWSVPCRTVPPYFLFFQYRTVSVRYGIDTAYRQSLMTIIQQCDWVDTFYNYWVVIISSLGINILEERWFVTLVKVFLPNNTPHPHPHSVYLRSI